VLNMAILSTTRDKAEENEFSVHLKLSSLIDGLAILRLFSQARVLRIALMIHCEIERDTLTACLILPFLIS